MIAESTDDGDNANEVSSVCEVANTVGCAAAGAAISGEVVVDVIVVAYFVI